MPEDLPILRPASTDDLVAAVQAAASSGIQVRVSGTDSLPLLRFDPQRPVQPVSTLRLNKVLHHAVADMTVCVQAGISLEALQKQLAWRDQWLPVDPPIVARYPQALPGSRTIGGLIASNSLGPLRFGGAGGTGADWRSLVLGMRWVDAAGEVIKGGGQTVKNVAGYSSPRMLIGSAGSLGILAEVTLRTYARPADERGVVFYCPNAAAAEVLVAAILVSPTTAAYVQAIGGRTFAGNPLQLPATEKGLVVVAGFLGRAESCAAQREIVRALAAARETESTTLTAAQAGRVRLWMTTEPAWPEALGFRLHLLSSQALDAVAAIERAAGTAAVWVVSEAATGVIRGALAHPDALATLQTFAPDARLLLTRGTPLSANPPPAPRPDPLFQRLKSALDPHSIFGSPPA